MSFELRVEFAGLCLYAVHSDGNRAAVVLPDARKSATPVHADGERGEPHAGYLRFDLANLDLPGMGAGELQVPAGEVADQTADSGDPLYEVVHRLGHKRIDFGLAAATPAPLAVNLALPHVNQFADQLAPVAGVFGAAPPPNGVLARAVVHGGTLTGTSSTGKTWSLASVLHSQSLAQPHGGAFAGFALWKRQLDLPGLTVTVSNFDGSSPIRIPLKPIRQGSRDVISLKVANLCAHNPLEWSEFSLHEVVSHDLDFKWIYRLLAPKQGTYKTALAGAELPFPRAVGSQAFGDEDCVGGRIDADFTFE